MYKKSITYQNQTLSSLLKLFGPLIPFLIPALGRHPEPPAPLTNGLGLGWKSMKCKTGWEYNGEGKESYLPKQKGEPAHPHLESKCVRTKN